MHQGGFAMQQKRAHLLVRPFLGEKQAQAAFSTWAWRVYRKSITALR
jgi:hypothetical protein